MTPIFGKAKDFLEFLNRLTKKDKIAIITHIDLDGIASAILMREILKQKKLKISSLNFINYHEGMFEEVEKNFKKGTNKIFILDINPESDIEKFHDLRSRYDVFLIDHHPFKIEIENMIKTKSEDCVTFAIFELAGREFYLDEWKELICATMIAEFSYNSKSNLQFLQEHYPSINSGNVDYSVPGEISKKISSALIYLKGSEQNVFDLVLHKKFKKLDKYHFIIEQEIQNGIEQFEKEAEFFPKKNLYFYYYSPAFGITSVVTTILSVRDKKKTFVFVSNIKSNPDFVKVSCRNQSGKEDLNQLMKKGVKGLENATGGGHIKAAGAMFMKKDLSKFKENILR